MKRVCVIGATSPFGVTLVPALGAAGHTAAASYRNDGLVPAEWRRADGIEPFHLDLKSGEPLPDLSCDALVWLAHLDAGRFNEAEPETNLKALERVLEKVSRSDVGKLIFISSGGSVYGHAHTLPITEEHERKPISSYGVAKKMLEDRIIEFGNATGIATVILRPGNIYGFERPGRKTKGVIAAFLNAIVQNTRFTLVHGGKTVRDMVHVDDVCRAVECAIEAEDEHIVWNVGSGKGTEVIDVLSTILEKSGRQMPHTEIRENYESDVLANILSPDRIAAATGWTAAIGLDEGLDRTLTSWNLLSRSNEAGT